MSISSKKVPWLKTIVNRDIVSKKQPKGRVKKTLRDRAIPKAANESSDTEGSTTATGSKEKRGALSSPKGADPIEDSSSTKDKSPPKLSKDRGGGRGRNNTKAKAKKGSERIREGTRASYPPKKELDIVRRDTEAPNSIDKFDPYMVEIADEAKELRSEGVKELNMVAILNMDKFVTGLSRDRP